MKLVKTSIFSAIITFIKIAAGFIAGKVIAVMTGPGGVALVGSFSNFISIVLAFANGAINNGVIKYTAEFHGNNFKLNLLFSTAIKISLFCSIIVGILIILFAPWISSWLFTSEVFINPVRVLGLTIFLYALNSLFISILNGQGEIKMLTKVNAIGSVIILIITITLVYFYNIIGALYALAIGQSVVFFATLFMLRRVKWYNWDIFKQPFSKIIALKLSHYSLMAIVSALTIPVSQILLRNFLTVELGIVAAGNWQGMLRVSDGYLMLITTALGTYYLPTLSRLTKEDDIRKEVFKGYKIILPTVILGCILIYYLRFIIIGVLYTEKFYAMEELFLYQLIGDFFKMAAWILGYLILAKAMTKTYIITEILFTVSFILLSYVFVKSYGLIGITFAFSLNYFIYLVVMLFFFRKLIFNLK